jgi:hypothetical protein
MSEFDANHDGFLDSKELVRCPGLKSVLAKWDKNKDGRLSAEEIEEGLAFLQEVNAGLMNVVCKVTLNDVPLEGATITLEPESFLSTHIKPAKGTTSERGDANVQVEGAQYPGCNPGLYRVRISKEGSGGKDLLPSRYNTETQLGMSVGSGERGSYTFRLTTP